MSRVITILLLFIITLASIHLMKQPACAQAGATVARVNGSVTDEQGKAIGGALVTAKNLNTNLTRSTTSAEDGAYLLTQLPPGRYEITAEAENFKTRAIPIELGLGTSVLLDLPLEVGVKSEVVEVNASSAIESRTESSTNINRQRIEALPINRRNFLDFSLTAARVTVDRLPPQGASATSGFSFNGQTARANNVTIDGLDNNDVGSGSVRSTFSQDAVQEFQVVSDSYSAEFGRALGGVVNIVTRGGGNDYHGSLFFFNRNDETSARDVFAPFEPDYKQYQFGAAISGPIKKDRAFFFTSFERLSIKQNNFIIISDQTVKSARSLGFELRNGPVPFAIGTTTALARGDVQLSPNDTLYVRYNYGGNYNGGFEPFGGLVAETAGGIQLLDDNTLAVTNTYINAGLNLVNETRFIYGRRNQDVVQVNDGPQVRIIAPEGQVFFGRGVFLPQPRRERITQIVNNVTLSQGRFQTKFGVDYLRNNLPGRKTRVPFLAGGLALFLPINFADLTGLPGLPAFSGLETFDPALRSPAQRAFLNLLSALAPTQFPGFPAGVPLANLPLPTAFAQGFGDTSLEVAVQLFSGFVQEEIKLRPNLLVKAGVRYDIARTDFIPDNNGNIAPRVAISYRPDRLPKLVARASYGIFFAGAQTSGIAFAVQNTTGSGNLKLPILPFPFSVLPFAAPPRRFPEANNLPPGVSLVPQLSQAFQYQPDLRNSYTQQVSTGLDYFLAENTAVSANYFFVRGVKLFASRNINPIVRPNPRDPVGSAINGRVDPRRGDLFQFESAFDSYYHALTLSFNRRFSNRVGLLAHYTFSKAIDNFIDFRVDQEGSVAVNPLQPRQERGLSLQDVRHRLVLSGIWDIGYTRWLSGFQLSTITNLESGRAYNLLAGVDLDRNGDNPPGDRPLIGGTPVGRNTGITPGFANVDFRITRAQRIGERVRVLGVVEFFNLFNRVNISDIDRIFPPDARGNFNLPAKDDSGRFIAPPQRFRAAFAPRQVQLSLRLEF